MKNILAIILCAFTLNAQAQVLGVGAAYEHDEVSSNRGGLNSISKAGVLAGARTKYGSFDASVYEVAIRGDRFFDTQQGVELGYGNGFQVGEINLSGRVGVGKVHGRSLGTEDTATYSTYTIAAGIPITKQFGVSISARYRPDNDLDQQQQYSLGANYAITQKVHVLGTIRHTRAATSPVMNGATIQVRYFF